MTYDALHLLFLFCCLVIQIVLPPHLENVRDKLAENIHELWGMNKIELGWMYGKVGKHLRRHNKNTKQHKQNFSAETRSSLYDTSTDIRIISAV